MDNGLVLASAQMKLGPTCINAQLYVHILVHALSYTLNEMYFLFKEMLKFDTGVQNLTWSFKFSLL